MEICTGIDYELLLFDRIEKIKQINEQYDLESNSYMTYSCGKDSTVLSYLLDLALPGNKIPRVFINTGIEYNAIRKKAFADAKKDSRFQIVNSGINIKKMLEENGYPFKSKEHSLKVSQYKNGSTAKSVLQYKNGFENIKYSKFACPKKLLYQYEPSFTLKISNLCCYKLKKDVIARWVKENKKSITMTGMRNEEGGQRANLGCIITKQDKVVKFHPIMPMKEDWIDWFVDKYKIKLCDLYYPPFNFKRTGCKGCPFAIDLQKQLDKMELLLPAEKKQCEILWKPVYDEYRRIGYRLNRNNFKQFSIYDFIEES